MDYKTSTIKAEMRKTFFAAQEHLAITVDDETLDVMLDEFYPEDNFLGLIPTLLPIIDDEEQTQLVWDRIQPTGTKPKMVPMLMCPEDLDLTCTTLIVKVIPHGDYIIWEKFGMDVTDDDNFPQSLGNKVEWLTKIKPVYFKRDEYMACIAEFEKIK
jgi:hypothetical protein